MVCGIWGDHRPRADNSALFDNDAVHDGVTHANDDTVFYCTSMDCGSMTNGDVVTYDGRGWFLLSIVLGDMNNGIVLDVGLFDNGNVVNVASEDSSIPY